MNLRTNNVSLILQTSFTIEIPGAALAGDGAAARRAPLGEQLAEAVRAVGRVLARRELLARQLHLAPRAHETFLQTNITYKDNHFKHYISTLSTIQYI